MRGARRGAGLVAAVALMMLAACGSGSDDADDDTGEGNGVFPVVVDHEFGSTTVDQEPERIVVAGLTEQDTVLQLGFQPIATTE